MNIKDFTKAYHIHKCNNTTLPPQHVPRTTFKQNSANGITKALISLFELIGGKGSRVNAAGVARGVKLKSSAYMDARGVYNPAVYEAKYTSSRTKSEPDVSGNFITNAGVAINVKIEVKYGRDTLKEKQEERLREYIKSGCIAIVASDFDTTAALIMDLKNDIIEPYKNKINLWKKEKQ